MTNKTKKNKKTPSRKTNKPRLGAAPGQAQALTAPVAAASVVRMARSPPVRITMREEISDVKTFQGTFANSPMAINPGNEECFPFLSKIAQHYETYYFEKLWFEYVANASSGNGGTVAIAVNPNADDPPFEDMKEALNREGSVSTAPWISAKADAKFKSSSGIGPKFVTDVTGAEALGNIFDDLHTIVDGVVNVITEGLNVLGANNVDVVVDGVPLTINLTESVTGKLYVNYTVVLYDPILRESADEELYMNSWKAPDASTQFWGVDADAIGNDGLKIRLTYSTSGAQCNMQFPETGTYMIAGQVYVTAFTGAGPVVLHVDSNANQVKVLGTISGGTNPGALPNPFIVWTVVEVLVPDGVLDVTFTGCDTLNAGNPNSLVRVAKVNDSTTIMKQFGGLSNSPLDCPKSKGFMELHRRLRKQKGAEAAIAAASLALPQSLLAKPFTVTRKPVQNITSSDAKFPKNVMTAVLTKTEEPLGLDVDVKKQPDNPIELAKMKFKIDDGYIEVEPQVNASVTAKSGPEVTAGPKPAIAAKSALRPKSAK